jgi:hypothetical protein
VPESFRRFGLTISTAAMLLAAAFSSVSAQTPIGPPAPGSDQPEVYRTTGSRVAIGRNIKVARDEEVSDAVVVIGGSLRVDGRVRDGLVVVGGNLELGPTADVRGDVVMVGGRFSREPGAQVRGSVSDVSFGEWGSWSVGGFYLPTVDFGNFGRWVSLFGATFRIALLLLLMAIALLLARAPVARIGRAAAAEPGRAFALGILAEIFFLPALIIASIGLIVTIIGIPLVALLVPVAFLAGFTALILGFTGLACHLGERVGDRLGWRGHSAFLAASIGLLLVVGPTLLSRFVGIAPAPIRYTAFGILMIGLLLEFVVWTMGLGATLMTGFGRWSTAPPPVPPAPPVPSGVVPVTG